MDSTHLTRPRLNLRTVVISVGENHLSETIYMWQPDGTVIWPTVGYGGTETANDSLGNPYYSYAFYNYSFTIDANQSLQGVSRVCKGSESLQGVRESARGQSLLSTLTTGLAGLEALPVVPHWRGRLSVERGGPLPSNAPGL